MYEDFLLQITNFIFIEDKPQKADIIFIPGNRYPQNAELAAQLYKKGYARYLLPSGKYSISAGGFSGSTHKQEQYPGPYETEWEFLKDVLVKNGVPQEAVLKEDQATYTYENAIYSRQAADRAGLKIEKAILCCKNFHARRCLMYYQRLFPETQFFVCPTIIQGISRENWNKTEEGVQAVTGEVTRIIQQFSLMMDK